MIAMDQIVNQAAKYRYFSGAVAAADDPHDVRRRRPERRAALAELRGLVLRGARPEGRDAVERAPTPRACSSPSIRDDDPVLFIETLGLLTARREVPRRSRTSCSRSASPTCGARAATSPSSRSAGMVDRALEAAEQLAEEDGVSVEVDRPAHAVAARQPTRSSSRSRRTGRLVVAQEATSPYSLRRRDLRARGRALPVGAEGAAGAGDRRRSSTSRRRCRWRKRALRASTTWSTAVQNAWSAVSELRRDQGRGPRQHRGGRGRRRLRRARATRSPRATRCWRSRPTRRTWSSRRRSPASSPSCSSPRATSSRDDQVFARPARHEPTERAES